MKLKYLEERWNEYQHKGKREEDQQIGIVKAVRAIGIRVGQSDKRMKIGSADVLEQYSILV